MKGIIETNAFVVIHTTKTGIRDEKMPFFMRSNGMFTTDPLRRDVVVFTELGEAETVVANLKEKIKGMDHPIEKTVRPMQVVLKEVS